MNVPVIVTVNVVIKVVEEGCEGCMMMTAVVMVMMCGGGDTLTERTNITEMVFLVLEMITVMIIGLHVVV